MTDERIAELDAHFSHSITPSLLACRECLSEIKRLRGIVEGAFREGYGAGYENGASDYASYEFGAGNKHRNIQKRDEDDAWRDSESLDAIQKQP